VITLSRASLGTAGLVIVKVLARPMRTENVPPVSVVAIMALIGRSCQSVLTETARTHYNYRKCCSYTFL